MQQSINGTDLLCPDLLGQTVPLSHNIPPPPALLLASASAVNVSGSGSGSSSRAVSTASSDSLNTSQSPMTAEDAKIIFSNVSELAVFSDQLSEELELALGDIVEGGQGEDCVGALFLRIVRISVSRHGCRSLMASRFPIWKGRTNSTSRAIQQRSSTSRPCHRRPRFRHI